MARPAIWLFTLALVADAILVNGRPPRFPSAQGKEVLEGRPGRPPPAHHHGLTGSSVILVRDSHTLIS